MEAESPQNEAIRQMAREEAQLALRDFQLQGDANIATFGSGGNWQVKLKGAVETTGGIGFSDARALLVPFAPSLSEAGKFKINQDSVLTAGPDFSADARISIVNFSTAFTIAAGKRCYLENNCSTGAITLKYDSTWDGKALVGTASGSEEAGWSYTSTFWRYLLFETPANDSGYGTPFGSGCNIVQGCTFNLSLEPAYIDGHGSNGLIYTDFLLYPKAGSGAFAS